MNISTPNWFSMAVCKGKTELFFPQEREGARARAKRETAARALCRSCPVLKDCQSHARLNSEWGIWGGENEIQRYYDSGTSDPVMLRKMKAKERRARNRKNVSSTPSRTDQRQAS